MKTYLFFALLLCIGCDMISANSQNDLKFKPVVDRPDDDTSAIQNPAILNLARKTKTISTDSRQAMRGLKLSFEVPTDWQELKTENPNTAYHFYDKNFNISLQIGISPPSNDSDITTAVKYKLENMFPGFLYDRKINVAGKNALQMEHARTMDMNGAKSYVNTSATVFFSNTQLVIFTYGSAKINKEDTQQNLQDLRLLYRHLTKTIELLR